MVWMEGLGSLRDKAARLQSLGGLAGRADRARTRPRRRSARRCLCKTDLLSEMIGSGKEYASLEGCDRRPTTRGAPASPRTCGVAIAEHYRPRGASDSIPESDAGTVLALADKLDHVAGAFVIGKIPSGSEDPYGVRRAGNGVIRILIERRRSLDLRDASMEITRPFFAADPELPMAAIMKKLGEFWRGRVEAALDERGVPYDVREAALEAQVALDGSGKTRPGWIDPHDSLERGRVLVGFRADPRFEPLVVLFRRVGNILKAATEELPQARSSASAWWRRPSARCSRRSTAPATARRPCGSAAPTRASFRFCSTWSRRSTHSSTASWSTSRTFRRESTACAS
mgnify:CR=1 FL=1